MRVVQHVGFGWLSQRSSSRPRIELHAQGEDGTWREITRFERLEGRGWFFVAPWLPMNRVGPFTTLLRAVRSSGVWPALKLIRDRYPVRISGQLCL